MTSVVKSIHVCVFLMGFTVQWGKSLDVPSRLQRYLISLMTDVRPSASIYNHLN